MRDYDPAGSFRERRVVLDHDVRGDEQACVDYLHARAGAGPVLELAVGTGRIALPLAARGLTVDGIDFSPQMLARLREKPGGRELEVHEADMVDFDLGRHYSLVFVVWNSFFNILEQDDQVRCFAAVARHLAPGGLFLVEAFDPASFHRLSGDQELKTEAVERDSVRIGALRHDPVTQPIEQNHVTLAAAGTTFDAVAQRYAWPAELDLMARLAGLELRERHGGWAGEPFTGRSGRHVSLYGFA